jgi:hypothetical protein
MGRVFLGLAVLATLLAGVPTHASTLTTSFTYVASPQRGTRMEIADGIGVFDQFEIDVAGYKNVSFSAADQRGPVGLLYRFSNQAPTGTLVCNGVQGLAVPAHSSSNFTLTVWFPSVTDPPPAGCGMIGGATVGTFTATVSS